MTSSNKCICFCCSLCDARALRVMRSVCSYRVKTAIPPFNGCVIQSDYFILRPTPINPTALVDNLCVEKSVLVYFVRNRYFAELAG